MPVALHPPLADLLTRRWANLHRSCPFAVHDCEVHYLTAMALGASDDLAAQLLLRKLRMSRRLDVDADRRVVRMNSLVEFVDGCGFTRLARLTHPWALGTPHRDVSVTSLLGAGLFGLAEGQVILWPDRTGELHPLKVISIGRRDRFDEATLPNAPALR